MLEGAGGNVTIAVGTDGILMVDTQFAPMHDKLKATIEKISPLPIKTIVITHFHGDHTGGIAAFRKDGAQVIAQDNIRLRLLAGTTNGTTGNKTQPVGADALPTETFFGGTKTIEVGGRKAIITHVYNAHTDGDSAVYFPDANVLATGDIMNNRHRYQQVDFANGGDIRGMIRGTNAWLKLANDGEDRARARRETVQRGQVRGRGDCREAVGRPRQGLGRQPAGRRCLREAGL
jgi:glyoxylase-like metal-dependent hydrolase (beta-lactamase superfamily II)